MRKYKRMANQTAVASKIERLDTTQSAMLFLINRLSGHIGKTQLVKLLFLADIEYYKQTGTKLTDFDYVFGKFGPFDKKIDKHIKKLEKRKLIRIERKDRSDEGYYFRFSPLIHISQYRALNITQLAILEEIAENFGKMTLGSLLEFVYNNPAVLNTKPGRKINFEKIKTLEKLRAETQQILEE